MVSEGCDAGLIGHPLSDPRGALVMKEIIKALEAAEGPDRSIDGMIAHAVNLHLPDDPEGWPLRYTESIDAALKLVPDGHGWALNYASMASIIRLGPNGVVDSEIVSSWPDNQLEAEQRVTPAIALCIAALKARSQIESLPANDSAETRLEI